MTDQENKRLARLIAKGLKEFPRVLARKEQAFKEKKLRMKAFKPLSNALQKQLKEAESLDRKVHPWRICPYGQYFRKPHKQRGYKRASGVQVRGSTHPKECAINKTGKDQLYAEEITEIAARYFATLTPLPAQGTLPQYPNESQFDPIIAGWTRYWNEVLKPEDPLDQNLVKALIATESAFDPEAWNRKKGKERARGLMQVTDESVTLLSNRAKELKDHFLNLNEDDMLDPNSSICAGIRWLFRKREILRSRAKSHDWIDTILLYKNYRSMKVEQMQKLVRIYATLKAGEPANVKGK